MSREKAVQTTEKKEKSNPYTLEKFLGVAMVSALAGVLVYYLYNELGEDTQSVLKEVVVDGVKSQVAKMAHLTPSI
ncbi:MAG: hypothetical protein ACLFQV_02755 [Vulcanimicrobiota bacterium]